MRFCEGLIIGGEHDKKLQLSFSSAIPTAKIRGRRKNDCYCLDMDEMANADLIDDFTTTSHLEGYKFKKIVFERTTELYIEPYNFLIALRKAKALLQKDGDILIWGYNIELDQVFLEQIRKIGFKTIRTYCYGSAVRYSTLILSPLKISQSFLIDPYIRIIIDSVIKSTDLVVQTYSNTTLTPETPLINKNGQSSIDFNYNSRCRILKKDTVERLSTFSCHNIQRGQIIYQEIIISFKTFIYRYCHEQIDIIDHIKWLEKMTKFHEFVFPEKVRDFVITVNTKINFLYEMILNRLTVTQGCT